LSAELKFDMAGFNSQVNQVKNMMHRNGRSYVRTTSRRLIRRLAWNAPIAKKSNVANRGRLRAGFWPAAMALGITNIYTKARNRGEGSMIDATGSASNPSFTITNSVPYLQNLRSGYYWVDRAKAAVQWQMARDLEKYAKESWARRSLIDDLSAE